MQCQRITQDFFFFIIVLFQQDKRGPTLSRHCLHHRPEILRFSTFMIASAHIRTSTSICEPNDKSTHIPIKTSSQTRSLKASIITLSASRCLLKRQLICCQYMSLLSSAVKSPKYGRLASICNSKINLGGK